jgi:hypothetical protein
MTVYVDELKEYPPKGYWCHMWSPNEEELHTMAVKIGLKRSWFQFHPYHSHYDLRKSKRNLAIENGAVPITCRELGRMTLAFGMAKKSNIGNENFH